MNSIILLALLCAEPDYRGLAAASFAAALLEPEQTSHTSSTDAAGSPAGETAPTPQPDYECTLFFSGVNCGWCYKMEKEFPNSLIAKRYDLIGTAHVWIVDPTIRELTPDDKRTHQRIVNKHGVTHLPTVIRMVNGKEVARHQGYLTPEQFKAFLEGK